MTPNVALRLGRVSNLPTVWTNALAGVVLAGGTMTPVAALGLGVALSCFYVGGMYLNDAFDHAVDARERPARPIPSGAVSARTVYAVGSALLVTGWALLGAVSADRLGPILGLALGAAIVHYDWRHKGDPLAPVWMGLCRALVYGAAAAAATGAVPGAAVLGGVLVLAYVVGLTYAARHETLAAVANLWPLAGLVAPVAVTLPAALGDGATAVALLAYVVWAARAVTLLRPRPRADIPGAVVRLIAGISLLDAVLIAAHGRPGLALVAAAAVPLTRLLQRWVPGT